MGEVTMDGIVQDWHAFKRNRREELNKVKGFFAFAVFVTGIVLISISLKKIEATEFAISYNPYTKFMKKNALGQGLKSGPP